MSKSPFSTPASLPSGLRNFGCAAARPISLSKPTRLVAPTVAPIIEALRRNERRSLVLRSPEISDTPVASALFIHLPLCARFEDRAEYDTTTVGVGGRANLRDL